MSIIIAYVTAYVHIWLTQNEEIKWHFRMAIKTQACSLMKLWMILLYISNWPGEAKGHYGILQQNILL